MTNGSLPPHHCFAFQSLSFSELRGLQLYSVRLLLLLQALGLQGIATDHRADGRLDLACHTRAGTSSVVRLVTVVDGSGRRNASGSSCVAHTGAVGVIVVSTVAGRSRSVTILSVMKLSMRSVSNGVLGALLKRRHERLGWRQQELVHPQDCVGDSSWPCHQLHRWRPWGHRSSR